MANEQGILTENSLLSHAEPSVFEVIDEDEARRRLLSVRLDAILARYQTSIEAGLVAVQQGKRLHVRPPSPHTADLKALRVVIQRLARSEPFHLDVRFDRATEGFIVREATAQEQQMAAERDKALAAARESQQQAQQQVAQSIMAQPVSGDVEAAGHAMPAAATAKPGARRSQR